jgi:3-methyl-2-oxobutanoate hydroxymethyltransferase
MKKTVNTFKKACDEGRKLALLTAYDYSTAKFIDSCDIDGILVGDSLGMVFLGYKDTLSVTMEDMIHHIKAVSRGVESALVVGDMPFMSYHASTEDAVRNAGRLVQEGGAEAVKLEGGANVIRQINAIVEAQIPVMAHIGLTPQSVNMMGGYKVQGRELEAGKKLIDDAKRLEEAGAFSIVLECIPEELGQKITDAVSIPTIGIGAGAKCDGQILVYNDMLGMYGGHKPKHVKVYSNIGEMMVKGVKEYVNEVRDGIFPTEEQTFKMNNESVNKLY